MISRECSKCGLTKELSDKFFRSFDKRYRAYFRHTCRQCEATVASDHNRKNISKYKATQAKWRAENPNYILDYKHKNRDKIRSYTRKYESQVNVKLRKRISRNINRYLNKNGVTKSNKSILKYLPYTMRELRYHLEAQFEPWMNWDNWGSYDPSSWDDSNPLTWTWQIDHIIPHSTFRYADMTSADFISCWALSNLRPLSSKQNIIDGALRVRHGV